MSDDTNTEYPQDPYAEGPHLLPLPKATLNSLMLDRMDAINIKADNIDNNVYALMSATGSRLARYQTLLYIFIALASASVVGIIVLLCMLSFLAGHVR